MAAAAPAHPRHLAVAPDGAQPPGQMPLLHVLVEVRPDAVEPLGVEPHGPRVDLDIQLRHGISSG